jgi:uncharacterized protein YjbI with pentapeptide repeats
MANEKQVEIINKGIEAWNLWRELNPAIQLDLSGANLSGMKLAGIDLNLANLNSTNFDGANLRNAKLISASLGRADLNGADLSGALLVNALLIKADLVQANLSETNCLRADFSRTDLKGANLNRANFHEAHLTRADLRHAKLIGADLSIADLSMTYLEGADLSEAVLWRTVFGDVDLRNVKGLEQVKYQGPCSIGIDTFQRSKGQIPEVFLRGTGVSDTFITYATSLTAEAIQYYSCFISYSSKDEAIAQRLHADLQQQGVRCWFASENMKIGDRIRSTIDQSIRIHDKLLLILSKNSLRSVWVESEVERAFAEERRRKQTVLFPVRLDEAVMETEEAWATEIRDTRHIGDFSRWKDHDAYQQAFERLLRDLKAEG